MAAFKRLNKQHGGTYSSVDGVVDADNAVAWWNYTKVPRYDYDVPSGEFVRIPDNPQDATPPQWIIRKTPHRRQS